MDEDDDLSQLGEVDHTEGSIGTQDDFRTEDGAADDDSEQSDDEVLPSIETDQEEDGELRESRPASSASQRSHEFTEEELDRAAEEAFRAEMAKEQSQGRAASSRETPDADGSETKSHSSRAGRAAAAADDASSHHTDEDVFSDKSPRSSLGSYDMGSESGKAGGLHEFPDNLTTATGRSPRISDISQYDKEDFVPTIRGTPRPAFRTPSDVRAMQMSSPAQSVTGGGDGVSPRSSRRYMPMSGSRLGTPTASAQYSPKRTPDRLKPARKEAPLVLLHCTLLPLRWVWGGLVGALEAADMSQDVKALRDAWRVLQDRMGDTTCERGILLGHPQSDYEVLEERLLEALELPLRRRARILECGHYLGPSNEMLGYDDDDDDESCLDSEEGYGYDDDRDDDAASGRRRSVASKTSHANKANRKDRRHWCGTCRDEIRYESLGPGKVFRVKVYASNGLMKAGAWEACWKEMERVDVEIEPIVAPAVQDELVRLAAARQEEADIAHEVTEQFREEKKAARKLDRDDTPRKAKSGTNANGKRSRRDMHARVDDVPDGASELEVDPLGSSAGQEDREPTPEPHHDSYANPYGEEKLHAGDNSRREKLASASFLDLLLESARVLLQDRKNLAILALSTFVLLLAVRTANRELPYEQGISGIMANIPGMRHIPALESSQAALQQDVPEQDIPADDEVEATSADQSDSLDPEDIDNIIAATEETVPEENILGESEVAPSPECDDHASLEGSDAELPEYASVPSERDFVDAAATATQDASSGYDACATGSAAHDKADAPAVSEAPDFAETEVEVVTEKKTVRIVQTVTETETQFECLRVTATEFIQLAEPTSHAVEVLDAFMRPQDNADLHVHVHVGYGPVYEKASCAGGALTLPRIDGIDHDMLEEPEFKAAEVDIEEEF